MAVKALIFDVDGTLAETEEAHRQAFNNTFKDSGMDWEWDISLYGTLLKTTGGKERMQEYQQTFRADEPQMDWARIKDLHAQKTRHYVNILASGGLPLRAGVADLIARAAKAGVRLAISTTTSRPNVDALTACCWGKTPEELFEVIATGEQVKTKKPAPDLFLLALDGLGLPPEDCLAFEDSRNGLLSAKAAGLCCIVTPGQYTADDDFSGADMVIPSLEGFEFR